MSYSLQYINIRLDGADDVVEYYTHTFRQRRTSRPVTPGPRRAANGAIPMDPVIADGEVMT